jgi:hypothetical protein
LANGEANSGRRERWGQHHADDAMAQQDTRSRLSQEVLTLVLVLHGPCREQLAVPAASSERNVHNAQPVTNKLWDQELCRTVIVCAHARASYRSTSLSTFRKTRMSVSV